MQPGYADVVHAQHLVAHEVRSDCRLVGHRQVTRPGTQHGDHARALGQALGLDRDAPGRLVVVGLRQVGRNSGGVGCVGASDEHAILPLHHLGRDGGNLFRRLAGAEDDLGESLPQRPVRVDLREAKVVDRRGAQAAQHPGLVQLAGLEAPEQLAGFLWCHRR